VLAVQKMMMTLLEMMLWCVHPERMLQGIMNEQKSV
jgi:hypothetical protein